MVSLVDIGTLRQTVELRGQPVEIKGLSADFIMNLLATSNEFRMVMAQKAIGSEIVEALVAQFPVVLAQCIAAATGKAGDADTIQFALAELSPGEQIEIITAVLDMTFPKGVKSFLDGLGVLAHKATGGHGWEAVMKSQGQSSAASAPGTTAQQSGDTPQDSSQHSPS